jgi:hypothetical protein
LTAASASGYKPTSEENGKRGDIDAAIDIAVFRFMCKWGMKFNQVFVNFKKIGLNQSEKDRVKHARDVPCMA